MRPDRGASIVILGAGLTGMSAARHLDQAGGAAGAWRGFERLERPGGHAITLEEDGFRFDRTGHLLHLRDPAVRAWVEQLLAGRFEHVQRRSMVFSHGVYTRYPFQANMYGLPPTVAYECLMGFLQAQARSDPTPPADFEQFCLRHFGEGISKHFMIPYNARLWGVHPREMTAAWAGRFVPLPKLEDVVAGAVGLNDRELGYNTSFVYPRLGIGELPQAMWHEVADGFTVGRAPTAIDWRRRELVFQGPDERVPYGALISTAPLKALIELMPDAPAAVTEAAARLRCNPLWYLDVALEVPCGTPYHWTYVPEDRFPFYRVGCYSHFSAAMAPPGKSCLYVELASRETPDLERLLPEVVAGLTEMGIVGGARDVRFARARRIDWAYVVFDHAYYDALAVIRPFLEEHAIVSAGRYGGWNYSSMEDALVFGREAAAEARRRLEER